MYQITSHGISNISVNLIVNSTRPNLNLINLYCNRKSFTKIKKINRIPVLRSGYVEKYTSVHEIEASGVAWRT